VTSDQVVGARCSDLEAELEELRDKNSELEALVLNIKYVAPWWSGERMQLQHMTHRHLYNQRSPLVVRRECSFKT